MTHEVDVPTVAGMGVLDQETRAPVVPSTAPMPMACAPPMFWNRPPTTTREASGEATSASTMLSAWGAQGSSAPVLRLNDASRWRHWLPTA